VSAGLGGLGVASGTVAGFVAAWRPFLIAVSAGSFGLAYADAYRRGTRRAWVWLAITTPLTLLAWGCPISAADPAAPARFTAS
jgi:hypothetical protein